MRKSESIYQIKVWGNLVIFLAHRIVGRSIQKKNQHCNQIKDRKPDVLQRVDDVYSEHDRVLPTGE